MSDAAVIGNDGAGEGADGDGVPAGASGSIEETARRMGWRPKEEYRGDPDKWRPAEDFVERGLNELPVLRDRYRALDERYAKDVGDLKSQVKEMGEVLAEFREFSSKSEERAYQRALRELVEKRDAAVMHADTETFKATQAEIEALNESVKKPAPKPKEETKPQEQPSSQPQVDPYTQQWVTENPWFNASPMLQGAAIGIHNELLRNEPGLSLRENLAKVRAEVAKRFPEKFENERRAAPSAVSEGGRAEMGRKKGKTYNDLPPDAKAACDRFTKTIKGFTREDYVKQYFGEEG